MVNTLAVDNEAKQTIEALQTELQKTKEKLQALEELKSQSGGPVLSSLGASLVGNLVAADAEVCLCALVKTYILGIGINLSAQLELLINNCGYSPTKTYTCRA
ncbi:hypothetical protein REPUB_Repub08aG0201100 [Reevesia pubescens]